MSDNINFQGCHTNYFNHFTTGKKAQLNPLHADDNKVSRVEAYNVSYVLIDPDHDHPEDICISEVDFLGLIRFEVIKKCEITVLFDGGGFSVLHVIPNKGATFSGSSILKMEVSLEYQKGPIIWNKPVESNENSVGVYRLPPFKNDNKESIHMLDPGFYEVRLKAQQKNEVRSAWNMAFNHLQWCWAELIENKK